MWHASASSAVPGHMERCCEAWLTAEERERADRFRVPTSRNQHVIGRGMARRLLGGEEVSPHEIHFDLLPHGKPIVQSPVVANWPFNVAHTDGLVMCGVSEVPQGVGQVEAVGVDVENESRRTDPALADRYFSRPEIEFLARFDGQQRRRMFLRIWTLKESFIKALGTGLQTPLADFAFTDIDSPQPGIEFLNEGLRSEHRWQFHSVEPRSGFIAAIAIALPPTAEQAEVTLRDFDELIAKSGI